MAATRKKKHLVIVESPAKAKTINKYLGSNFEVAASKGHVRDLPKSRLGIDIEAGWVPNYRPLNDRKALLADLKKQASKADLVYLAPDPDREGEAIAWHLKEALGLDDARARRVTFNEITKAAVQKAFAHPGQINPDLVAAQEARRFLDRIVGYNLSPLLSRKLAQHLSAGRVQSVAVRLVVEREREIQNFKPEEYWRIIALLRTVTVPPGSKKEADQADQFQAELAEWTGQKFAAHNQAEADAIVAALEGASFSVARVEQKDRQEKAPPPFTTSTLQQQASLRLRFSARRTMMIAQRLYEGVELGGDGSVGLITYMRTDSTRVSNEALQAVRSHIQTSFGAAYLPGSPNRFTSGKSAQEAHEAIRPTDLSYTPQRVAPHLPQDQLKLYTLIYNRFVASQMNPAIFAITNVAVAAAGKGVGHLLCEAPSGPSRPKVPDPFSGGALGVFKAQGRIMKFDGYRRVLPPAGKQEDALLPPLAEQQPLDLVELKSTQHFTEPPPRYNEASLVKMLEKEGIGRPSTYAAIIGKIQDRGYVEQKERRFYATAIGMTVTDLLVEHFPKVMDLKFTSHMEGELDQIEKAACRRNDVLNEFYAPFLQDLKVAEAKMQTDAEKCPQCGKPLVERFSRFGRFFGCSGHPECKYIKKRGGDDTPREPPKETEHSCPECGKPMLQRMGKRGPFLGCSGYPDCKTTMNFAADGKPVLASKPTPHVCDKCGKPMVLREGKRGPFLACSGYPKCRNAKDVDAQGNPIGPIETGFSCVKCGSPMVVKRGPRGPFLGCSAYPKCRSTKKMPDDLKEKLQDVLPPSPPPKEVPKVEIRETCPECGGPMKLRPGRRGYFLGCSKYPKCKGTREVPPDLQLQ